MVIGLPRALLFFKYRYLWEKFFEKLGCKVVLSEETNKKILAYGIRFSIDESCLPAKIYMGHIYSLIGKCDYILIPRIENFGPREGICAKFNATYDIVQNTFKDAKLLDYNIDVLNGKSELKGFIGMGKTLRKSYFESLLAYIAAKKVQAKKQKFMISSQFELLNSKNSLKILIVSHPYNIYDKAFGHPIINYLKKLGALTIFADVADSKTCIKKSSEFSKNLYWTYNKELIGAIGLYQGKVDGIIIVTAFPCGPDSLVNELMFRKLKDIPVINIILDELQGEAGLQTRIESFVDIIKQRKGVGMPSG